MCSPARPFCMYPNSSAHSTLLVLMCALVMPRMNASWVVTSRIYKSCHKYKEPSHIYESCHLRIPHVYEACHRWVMSHIDESCHTLMSPSHVNGTCQRWQHTQQQAWRTCTATAWSISMSNLPISTSPCLVLWNWFPRPPHTHTFSLWIQILKSTFHRRSR